MTAPAGHVAIVDCALGNLFSIRQALTHVGLLAEISHDIDTIKSAAAVVLPGIGAFGDAMRALRETGLDRALREFAATGRPLIGICLGMQLLFSESNEFGKHQGLGLIEGDVVRFPEPQGEYLEAYPRLKIPLIGWNQLVRETDGGAAANFEGSLLSGLPQGTFMYFLHSYYVRPADLESVMLTRTQFGELFYCSALRQDNIQAFQFHPERSGEDGLRVFRNLAEKLNGEAALHDEQKAKIKDRQ